MIRSSDPTRRFLPALVLPLVCAACASSGNTQVGPEPAAAVPVELRRGVEGTWDVVQKGRPLGGVLEVPVTQAWTALQETYDDLDLKVTKIAPREGRVASERQRLVRLNGRRASYYVDCGRDYSGPIADDATVELTVTSAIEAQGKGRVILATQVDASAQRRNTNEGMRDCTSTGKIEALVLQHVMEHAKH